MPLCVCRSFICRSCTRSLQRSCHLVNLVIRLRVVWRAWTLGTYLPECTWGLFRGNILKGTQNLESNGPRPEFWLSHSMAISLIPHSIIEIKINIKHLAGWKRVWRGTMTLGPYNLAPDIKQVFNNWYQLRGNGHCTYPLWALVAEHEMKWCPEYPTHMFSVPICWTSQRPETFLESVLNWIVASSLKLGRKGQWPHLKVIPGWGSIPSTPSC